MHILQGFALVKWVWYFWDWFFFSDECCGAALSRWRSGRWCTWLWPTTTAWSTAERPWPSSERSNLWWRTLGCCCWTCERSRTANTFSSPTEQTPSLHQARTRQDRYWLASCWVVLSCIRPLGLLCIMEEHDPVIVCPKHALCVY